MTLKAVQIYSTDVSGANVIASVVIVDRDKLRRETGPSYVLPVQLSSQEKNVFQAVRDRGIAKLQARLDKANADVTADPNAPVDLNQPINGEQP